MQFNPDTHHRQSIRLPGFDYASPSAYFVTIVSQNRECLFGDVVDGVMVLNELGRMVERAWKRIPSLFTHVGYDPVFMVMPNHFHGIIWIHERPKRRDAISGRDESRPYDNYIFSRRGGIYDAQQVIDLGEIVRSSKSLSTRSINDHRDTQGTPVWQRNYHEHIIRNDAELNRIRQYIADNLKNSETDEDNPQRWSTLV